MNPATKTVLIVDQDPALRQAVIDILRKDYRVVQAASGEQALALLTGTEISLVLLNVHLPGVSGFEVLRLIKENFGLIEVIMISSSNEVEVAVQAMKDGAYHYINRDFDRDALKSLVRNASERQDLNRRVMTLSAQVQEQSDREFVIGHSRVMQEVANLARKVAKLPATILILGESGTGKELLARLMHRESDRADAAFITVNLAAIPRELVESTLFGHERGAFTGAIKQQLGKFELASGGTLLLDEIGDLRMDLQAKLLRAIQEGEIERIGGAKPIPTDFRLIAATNVDLEKAVKEGRFREDLYYRINVIPLRLPPLRERIDDLPDLAAFFLQRYNAKFHKRVLGISDSTLKLLGSYWWPGNIRELENLIERLVAVSEKEWITEEELPFEYHVAHLDATPPSIGSLLQVACDTFERNFILKALEKSGWQITATARYLGIPLSTLKHKMDRLEIRELAKRLRGSSSRDGGRGK